MMNRIGSIACGLLLLTFTGLAAPGNPDLNRLKPLTPAGFTVSNTSLHLPLSGPGTRDLVGIMVKGDDATSRVVVVPAKGSPRWCISKGKPDLPAPVQSLTPGDKITDLVYSANLKGKVHLFVTTFLAESYTLHVFAPTAKDYQEVFQVSSMERPRFDPATQVLHAVNYDGKEPVKVNYTWKGDRFVKAK